MASYIDIRSNDNTDTLILIDKIQYVIEKKDCCEIGLINGEKILTGAKFSDVRNAIKGFRR